MPYKVIGAFFLVAIGLCFVLLLLSLIRGKQRPSFAKNQPYECGFDAFESGESMKRPFKIQYYLIGILFIIFDIEIVLLIPWALSLKTIGLAGYCSMLFFLMILTVGFIYEWHKKALQWD